MKKIIVSGRVQGVFFREFTKRKADSIGVAGTVRNLDDGTVEIIAAGDRIDKLIKWCWTGPPSSKVERVVVSNIESFEVTRFSII